MRNTFFIMLLLCIAATSCRNSSRKTLLGNDSMKVVLFDIMKADELYARILAKDSTAKKRREDIRLYDEVFALHHITKGMFDSSYKFYESHPVEFKRLIDSLDALAVRERNKLFEDQNHGQAPKHK